VTSRRIISSVKAISSHNRGSIEAVGITVPGLVDPAGVAIYVPYFKWRGIPIGDVISRGTGLPVRIDNDANSIALAELWFGRPEITDARDFIMILVAEGVGTGIIIDGQVYRGERGAAGEFGHMIVGAQAPLACSCGNFDCWEAFASEGSALARYRKLRGDRPEDQNITFPQLMDTALSGEEHAANAIAETAHYLGIGISNLVVGFSPEVVVVSGEITRAWSMVEIGFGETIERSIRRGLPSARITASTLGDQPTLMGAISLVLASKFAADFAA
jgi:predicted NBD/HSP70 family sugar kinase